MRNLPPEILVKIFDYLPAEHVTKKVLLVCKQWYEAVQNSCHSNKKEALKVPSPINYNEIIEKLMLETFTDDKFQSFIKSITAHNYPTHKYTTYNIPAVKAKKKYISTFEKKNREDNGNLSGEAQMMPIIKCCPNLEKLKIFIRTSDNVHELLEEVIYRKPQCKPRELRYLEIKLISNAQPMAEHKSILSIPIHMADLIDRVGCGLQKLIIQDSACYLQNQRLDIRSGKLVHSSACFLKILKIISPNSTITRACLEYLTSSRFGGLEELYLFLKVKYSINGSEDEIWARIRNLCLSRLEKYNICLRDEDDGSQLLSIDNCESNEKSYEHHKNVDTGGDFILQDKGRAGYEVFWEDDWP